MSALAMAERAVSAAELGENTIANFEISDQAIRRQGHEWFFFFSNE